MNLSASVIKRVLAVGLLAAVAASAWAQPVTVVDGSSNVTVPVYPGPFSPPPLYTVLGSTGIQPDILTVNGVPTPVAFDEFAVTTPLNPFNTKTADGVALVFAVAAGSAIGPGTLSGLSGFTGYQTAVEGCDPLTVVGGSAATCSHPAGTVSRAGGTLNFSNIQLSSGTINIDGFTGHISYAYAIFTNASSWKDPTGACFTVPGAASPACFDYLTPSGSTVGGGGGTGAPEPASLGLLGLGLLGMLAQRARRRR